MPEQAAEKPLSAREEFQRRYLAARQRIADAGARHAARRAEQQSQPQPPPSPGPPLPPPTPAKTADWTERVASAFSEYSTPLSAGRIIQDFICQRYGLERQLLLSKSRRPDVAWPRFVGIYLVRSVLKLATPKIGRLFGGRDHSTVLHSIDRVAERGKIDPDFASKLAALETEIRGLLAARPIKWGRYVVHERVDDFLRLGWHWQARLNDHGCLMIWLCDCQMREP